MVAVDIIRQNLGENSYQILVDEDIIPKAGSLARSIFQIQGRPLF